MNVTTLPADALCRILKKTDQAGRVSCLVACTALHAAAVIPGTWDAVDFEQVDQTCVDFVVRHKTSRIRVANDVPDETAWFLHRVADRGGADHVRSVQVVMREVGEVPDDLFAAAGRFETLETLEVSAKAVEDICEVEIRPLPRLTKLRVVEDETRSIMVNFDEGCFPSFTALADVELRVASSNVLDGVHALPGLRCLVYRNNVEFGEPYDTVKLQGCVLDHLELDINEDSDNRTLFRQLGESHVRRLSLHVHGELVQMLIPVGPALEELDIDTHCTHAALDIDFPTLSGKHPKLKRIETRIAGNLVFRRVPSMSAWMTYFSDVDLQLHWPTQMCVSLFSE